MKQVPEFYDQFDSCRQYDIPACADACPFGINILDIQERVEKKRFNAAYKSLRDCLVFPAIVSEICPGYCQDVCIRKVVDEPVQIREMEKAIIELATRKDPNSYNLPSRNMKVAVIGAGLSGLAFALKMASRKFDVTVFERENVIGGQLRDLMDEDAYMTEIQLQFKNEKCDMILNTEASLDRTTGVIAADGEKYDDFDIIYVATGAGGENFGIDRCIKIGDKGVFTGGSLSGKDTMFALADGVRISLAADDFARTGTVEYPSEPEKTKCIGDIYRVADTPATKRSGNIYTEEEAVAEAKRCIRCQCNACENYCDLVSYYGKWPLKMRDEIFLSVKPAGSLVHKCPSRKYIAACTDCKAMEDLCPESIELCGMIKSARHQMHEVDKMPQAYKQYYVRDMEFANGEFASVVRKAPGHDGDAGYAFFPGCNLGALDPEYVISTYKWILEQYPDAALMLGCCSLPADWAGIGDMHDTALRKIHDEWEMLGKPVLIMACMSCSRHIKENLPDIPVTDVYQLMSQHEDKLPIQDMTPEVKQEMFSVFDPCSARGNDEVQQAVRDLAAKAGVNAEELPRGDKHGCCGYGGQGAMAQPEFTSHIVGRSAGLSQKPYIVYCSNCRDIFKDQGKKAVHILDIAFDIDPLGTRPNPGVTERRRNRVVLKERMLEEIWGEKMADKPEEVKYELVMNPEITAKANSLRIINDDICNVIEHAEKTGRRTRNPENGHYKAYNEIGAITLWVEYGMPDGCSSDSSRREIFNLYTHRLQIKMEAVFNGKKIDG